MEKDAAVVRGAIRWGMKAISIREPWASMIREGIKSIETRTWYTSYRGPLLICASKRPDMMLAGHAVAKANLVEVRLMILADEERAACSWYPEAFAWVLENVQPIDPFPVKGRLGLFDVEIP